jgi:hypothetical protein
VLPMQLSTTLDNVFAESGENWVETSSAQPRRHPVTHDRIISRFENEFPNQLFKSFICKTKIGLELKGLVGTENGSHVLYKTDARFQKDNVLKRHIAVLPANGFDLSGDWYFMRLINYENPSGILPFPPLQRLKGQTKESMKVKMKQIHGGIFLSKEQITATIGIALKRTSEITDPITKIKNYTSFQLSGQTNPIHYVLVLIPIKDGTLMVEDAVRSVHFTVKSSNARYVSSNSGTKRKRAKQIKRNQKMQANQLMVEKHRIRKHAIEIETKFIRSKIKQMTDLFKVIREDLQHSNEDDFFHMSMMHHTQNKEEPMAFF